MIIVSCWRNYRTDSMLITWWLRSVYTVDKQSIVQVNGRSTCPVERGEKQGRIPHFSQKGPKQVNWHRKTNYFTCIFVYANTLWEPERPLGYRKQTIYCPGYWGQSTCPIERGIGVNSRGGSQSLLIRRDINRHRNTIENIDFARKANQRTAFMDISIICTFLPYLELFWS